VIQRCDCPCHAGSFLRMKRGARHVAKSCRPSDRGCMTILWCECARLDQALRRPAAFADLSFDLRAGERVG